MNKKERAPLGFGNELDDFDPAAWTPSRSNRGISKPTDAAKAAEAAGFQSREPKGHAEVPVPRRRRTGRNVQFNIKTRQETIDLFCSIADARGWGLGETFERATEILAEELRKQKG